MNDQSDDTPEKALERGNHEHQPPSDGTEKAKDSTQETSSKPAVDADPLPEETGGPKGPEPTRYGDWERRGRCIDF
jgi:hypothetical protein